MRKAFRFVRGKLTLLVIVAMGIAVGSAATAVVMAAIPDAGGLIHGCYRTSNGSLRVIDSSSQACNSNETALLWNQASKGGFLANLVGANFSSASLQYRQFSGIDMHDGNFTEANLTGSDLTGADLTNAILTTASLEKANLQGANLTGASIFHGTNDTNFQNANLTNAQLTGGGDFRGANIQNITITGNLSGNFNGLDFTTASFNLQNLPIFDGDFGGANFGGLSLSGVQILDSNLDNANFSGATLGSRIFFGEAGYNDTGWTPTDPDSMVGTNFTNAHFVNAVVASDLSQATLTGATWSNTICPDGTNSDTNGSTCIGHLVL